METSVNNQEKGNIYQIPEPKQPEYQQITHGQQANNREAQDGNYIYVIPNRQKRQETSSSTLGTASCAYRPKTVKSDIRAMIYSAMILFLLVLSVSMQVVTVTHLNIFPVVCSTSSETVPSPLTYSDAGADELLQKQAQMINFTMDVLYSTNRYMQNSQETLQQFVTATQDFAKYFTNISSILFSIENPNTTTRTGSTSHNSTDQMSQKINNSDEINPFYDEQAAACVSQLLDTALNKTGDFAQILTIAVSSLSHLETIATGTIVEGIQNLTSQNTDILTYISQLINNTREIISNLEEYNNTLYCKNATEHVRNNTGRCYTFLKCN